MTLITRFAPSPTGNLHLGHAHAALYAWLRARAAGGVFLLRMEDIDSQRCRPAFAKAIIEDLRWLGLDWDGGVRVQSDHLSEYASVVTALASRGLVYRCFCSRADVARAGSAPHGPEGAIYPGTCRSISTQAGRVRAPHEPFAWRLNMQAALLEVPGAVDAACFGDVVIARRDSPGSYHLCSVHDDAVQSVTLVTRGEDLAAVRPLHALLQKLCGWPQPHYEHFALLTDTTGRRLSKRNESMSLRVMRAAGATSESVRLLAGFPPRPVARAASRLYDQVSP